MRTWTRPQLLIGAALVSLLLLTPLAAAQATLVSRTPSGTASNGESRGSAISANGAVMAFVSTATDMATQAGPGLYLSTQAQVRFLDGDIRDGSTMSPDATWAAGTTTANQVKVVRIDGTASFSLATAGGKAFAETHSATLSNDAAKIAFVGYEAGKPSQVYVYDRTTQAVTLASRAADGVAADRSAVFPRISADGSVVLFTSSATNLPGATAQDALYASSNGGPPTRISNDATGGAVTAAMGALTADGRHAFFIESAPGKNGNQRLFTTQLGQAAGTEVAVDAGHRDWVYTEPSASNGLSVLSVLRTLPESSNGEIAVIRGSDVVTFAPWSAGSSQVNSCANTRTLLPGAYQPRLSSDGSTLGFWSTLCGHTDKDSNGRADVYSVPVSALRISSSASSSDDSTLEPNDEEKGAPTLSVIVLLLVVILVVALRRRR